MDLQNIISNAILCFLNLFIIFVPTIVVNTIYEQATNKGYRNKHFKEWI